jgi:hypothetical protein
MRLGGPQGRSGRRREVEIIDPTGSRTTARSQSVFREGGMPSDYKAMLRRQGIKPHVPNFVRGIKRSINILHRAIRNLCHIMCRYGVPTI